MEGSVKIGPCRGFGLSPAEEKRVLEEIGAFQCAIDALRRARETHESIARPDLGPSADVQIDSETTSESQNASVIDIAEWLLERSRVDPVGRRERSTREERGHGYGGSR
jgi:hypothetical protein